MVQYFYDLVFDKTTFLCSSLGWGIITLIYFVIKKAAEDLGK
jgi:hypothetical protein